jgi:hypothetical protein
MIMGENGTRSKNRLREDELKNMVIELQMLERELALRQQAFEPCSYGLPDLSFGRGEAQGEWSKEKGRIVREALGRDETPEEYKLRQREAVLGLIGLMRFKKDEKNKKIFLIDQQLDLIVDYSFGYTDFGVLWGPRGGGKSLMAAIVIWIKMVYRKKSIVDFAGSGPQALAVYEYVKNFFECFPRLNRGMVRGDPLKWRLHMRNGVSIYCAEKEDDAVGKHLPGFIGDEAATSNAKREKSMLRVMQGCMSEEGHFVLFLSTMHHPTGMFVEYWDYAHERGYTRYNWTIFDLMDHCKQGLSTATEKDPQAKNYCMKKCRFTRWKQKRDDLGRVVGMEPEGCCVAETQKGG